MSRISLALSLTLALAAGCTSALAGQERSQVLEDYGPAPVQTRLPKGPEETGPATRPAKVDDAALAAARRKGVAWVLEHQNEDGGWSSGAHGSDGSQAPSDVATTAFSVLALTRDGGGAVTHGDAVRKGVGFVLAAVEAAPSGPRLRTPQGTQIQGKLGPNVDTHLAALMLGEVAGSFDPETNARVDRALDVVVAKVQQAQNADGSFDANGWAPVLSSSIAAQGLYAASKLGKDVDDGVLAKSDEYQAKMVDTRTGGVDASAGAGVELYAVATSLRTNSQTAKREGKAAAEASEVARAQEVQQAATARVTGDSSGRLMAGFGSIGGEEMLSYMMISDTLAEEGGEAWTDWEKKVGSYLSSIQNQDGSWVGHHCITSRAFTTAGAVMTLAAGDHARRVAARG